MAKASKDQAYSGFDLSIGLSFNEGFNRDDNPRADPSLRCNNCDQVGHCVWWNLYREVNAFGNIIKQTRQVIECLHCKNELVVGSMDFPTNQVARGSSKSKRKFNLRKLTKEQLAALMNVISTGLEEEKEKEDKS